VSPVLSDAELARPAQRIAQTREAEIDREHVGGREAQRSRDGMLARPAAGDEQRDTKDEADGGALTESQTDDEARDEKNQTDGNAEGETVGAIKRTS